LVNGDTTANNTSQLNFAARTGASAGQWSTAIISAIHGARVNGQYPTGTLVFSTAGGANTPPFERMRINASGNVHIGGATDLGRLAITANTRNITPESGPHGVLITTGSLGQAVWMGYDGISDFAYINSAKAGSVMPIMINSRGGGAAVNSTTLGGYSFYVSGTIGATGEITAYASDQRLKTNIAPISEAIERVRLIKGITFDWDSTKEHVGFKATHQKDVGVLAQEILEVLPEAVRLAPFDRNDDGSSRSGENYLTVQYEKLTALLIEAVKDLDVMIAAQGLRIKELETQLASSS
jgi:hypothetical protein